MPELKIDESGRLYYQLIQGDADRPYLVFLHEGLGCHAMWKRFPERLCRLTGFPGLVYDRLGYGRSSSLTHARTIDYLHEYALVELPALLGTVIADRPFILYGHSDGGSISLIYAAERPPLLKGVITEAAHVFVEPETIAGVRSIDEKWEKGELRRLSTYHGEKTGTIFKAWSNTWLSDGFRSWNIESLLPRIEVPLLAIQGTDDPHGTLNQVEAIVSGSAGDARRAIIEHCGHAPHLEAQEDLLEILHRFVRRIT